ncbi:MAG: 5'-3' exonuclease H3TH domain-containing protein, partial [Pseudomonadales bacterium]
MKKDYQLVLIDGSSYLFRAFHALPALVSSKGQPTGAIKGVISMIRRLAADYADSHIAAVFDAKGKTFRNDLYPEYKANRPPLPDELRSQIAPIHDIIKLMGIPLLVVEGVEADDVIGTLARQATEAKMDVLISTSDKDMTQLVTPHVTLIDTMKDAVLDEAGVMKKFGVRPDQIIDYLALVGDTSDNIPGVPKCGAKTAVKWLDEHQTLDVVMANADEVPGKLGENLRASLEMLPLSQQLTTIKTDVQLDCTVAELKLSDSDQPGLLELFKEYEFKSWVTEIGAGLGAGAVQSKQSADSMPTEYQIILKEAELDQWLKKLQAADCFALDTETTSIDYMVANLVGVSFCCEPGKA